jgi:hypothetical protein
MTQIYYLANLKCEFVRVFSLLKDCPSICNALVFCAIYFYSNFKGTHPIYLINLFQPPIYSRQISSGMLGASTGQYQEAFCRYYCNHRTGKCT